MRRFVFITSLFAAANLSFAQPQQLANNLRPENPGRNATAAASFDVNATAVANGAPELTLQLPGGPMAVLRRGAFQSRGANSGLWRGAANLRNDTEVLLTLRNGFLAGTIQIGQDLWEFRPQGPRHIVEKLDISTFPPCGGQRIAAATTAAAAVPGLDNENQPTAFAAAQSPGERTSAQADANTVYVDLLSVYTPQARTASGGTAQIEALIQSAVDRANLSFSNSLVNTVFRLARVAEVAHDDAGNLDTDLNWVRTDPTVAALRNESGADLVSLVVENGAGYCGLGYVMRSVGTSFASSAFQVTARSCAVGNLSFAHEHGHNIGLEHDPVNGPAPTSASYPWSFGHFINGSYRTVMSYSSECPNGCTRVTQFSNPSVIYNGAPTGIADQRDNARTARSTTPVAAAFRAEAPTAPPAAPTSLNAVAVSASQINLTWVDNSSNESGFRIYRSTDGVNFGLLATTAAGAVSYSNTGLPASTSHSYRVTSFNTVGESLPTNDASATTNASAPPAAPDTLTAASASSSQINLTWADRSTNETGFQVERSINGGSTFSLIATAGANAVAYSNTGLTANTTYVYRVRAINADGSSAYSNTAQATTPQAVPAVPGSFAGAAQYTGTGKNKTLNAISLTWLDVTNNTGYNVERCKQSGRGGNVTCSYAPLTSPGADAVSFLDSSAAASGKGTYQFRIRSFNGVGASAWTAITVNAN